MRLSIHVELDYFCSCPTDVLLAVEAAPLPDQILVEDLLTVGGAGPLRPIAGGEGIGQRTWMRVDGQFHVDYRATVDVDRQIAPIDSLPISPPRDLPAELIPYIWPSRDRKSVV